MVEIELDGKKVDIVEGSMIMHAADKAGTYIPHFCYHKKLSIAANCRMCLVDVEKAPKPMPACATPVTQGMIVRTKSDKAIKAQQSVMEFLLINHPLDCPICDQGGECQLQDLAVGYGASSSRYEEEKRVVFHKDVGPLISMEEMSRCIHCTRCVRFGQEVAGVMELGMTQRGEHSEIETFLGDSVDSELSGNMIDICPVGALTSKPFRYSARTWELSRRKSVSPHDSTGANLIVQVKNNRVMRVVPLENEDVNECWIADRDRFSYEALNGPERLTQPMLKQGGQWQQVDWQTALEYVANGLKQIKADHGAHSIGTLASPHSTLEELHLAKLLMQGLGSANIDHRLRHAEFRAFEGVRWLGTSIASLSQLQRVLVIGSNLRKDHPLFAQRIRQAVRKGGALSAITSPELLADDEAWAMPVANAVRVPAHDWIDALAEVAGAIAATTGAAAPVTCSAEAGDQAKAIAASLLGGERKAILLGNAAAHHAEAGALLALANWIGTQTGASVGYLTEAANTVGAQLVGALPMDAGLNAGEMLSGALKAVLLLNTEPVFDSAAGTKAADALTHAQMVVTLSPFKANLEFSDVLLPIAPFSETPGSFVNAEGRVQGFHAVVKALGETRPAWKVLRVLANLLGLPGFSFESVAEVQADIGLEQGLLPADRLSNATGARADSERAAPAAAPAVASIYQLDSIVRRAPSLQLTADARAAHAGLAQEVLA
ncbi:MULTISPECIES: NADH-quinone oxidoreductase subunit NuoG [unclassified Variovorax]|uniref:NADH-quinone oxidoreductase subunit NuoG n=1 Tax=unclassified Variovorax TaxID=663243 RepID=UPI00076C758D|nr:MULTISPECIES: NADH-quinone oxidoreductase subunit NuoG [unclassified Variovorax]KWT88167.1 NADH-ubiquinone oxidoreductase chain G [Variovorax sp. WDL1]PNG51999.1 NADH-quinone oxidoreductase chain 3 [Variovorax sp. B4]PNG54539.1 NADH-quinone oxidoreductase chain 3 [Variovorax sp. B2]VTV15505.1 NADH-quinone oxidoreductase chain 3 [Variovorax sp. WDL1]